MSYDIQGYQLNTGYEVHTPIFEGPLDLLLHLIQKEQLDITQVALAQVTDQFLAYVETMRGRLEIAVIADFLAVSAHLILIKSRVLLPRQPEPTTTGDTTDDVGDELVRQLRAYRQYKEAAQWLRERNNAGLHSYIGPPPKHKPQQVILDLTGITFEKLYDTAVSIFYPSEGPKPQEAIQRPRISIVQQIQLIRENLKHWKQVTFNKLLSKEPTRLEVVVTLQAILELIKQRSIQAMQADPFGEITVEARVPAEQISEPSISQAAAQQPQEHQ